MRFLAPPQPSSDQPGGAASIGRGWDSASSSCTTAARRIWSRRSRRTRAREHRPVCRVRGQRRDHALPRAARKRQAGSLELPAVAV